MYRHKSDVALLAYRVRARWSRICSARISDNEPVATVSHAAPCGRLKAIEGMRAYLALWVLVCHVLWMSGYTEDVLSGPIQLLVQGRCAVDVFIVISGFVIFFVLDRQQESWKAFIVRRFFRLFPLFIVLFLAAIVVAQVTSWNVAYLGRYWEPEQIQYMNTRMDSWGQNLQWHLPLHLLMLHGMVPQGVLPHSPGAFLVPGWSVSLEWQFYLVAPFAFILATSSKRLHRIGLCASCALLFVLARPMFPAVDFGAAVPLHVEFFFIGGASYFLFKRNSERRISDNWFGVCAVIALFFLVMSNHSLQMISIAFWTAFLGLMLEEPTSFPARCVAPLFTGPLIQWLGRISYSIYLVHLLVIIVAQRALLIWIPELSQIAHFWLLLAVSIVITLPVSALLYHSIEAPAIRLGRFLARKVAAGREFRPAPTEMAVQREVIDAPEPRPRALIIEQR